jgi:TRAP-type C4-dicarboxylate transport system permease large subunit
VFVLNLMIGTVTPPVGVVLYVVSNIARISFERMSRPGQGRRSVGTTGYLPWH